MKGCSKSVQTCDHLHTKTNFNDWSDPKCKPPRRKTVHKRRLSEELSENEVKEDEKCSISSNTSLEIEQLRKKIKEGYPLLSKKEIRQVRLSFFESLLSNLKEDGFYGTFEFIADLIVLDEDWHREGDDPTIKNRPYLKFDNDALSFLCKGLMEAEIAKREGNISEEVKSLLAMAVHFSDPNNEIWHWLAEELFEQCVTVGDEFNNYDPRLEAISKHVYASFLLYTLRDLKRAKLYVEESMLLSIGKSWNASEITGTKDDFLYFESCFLLHKIFLEMAYENKESDIEHTIQLCRSSLHWAKEINSKSAEASALMHLVIMYLSAGQLTPVLGHLENYKKLCEELEDNQGVCESYILKARYHGLLEEDELVIEDIQELLNVAEKHQIIKMMAIAHRKLATFYLILGKESEMQLHAVQAYSYYVKLNSKLEMEETRCLTGIAQAKEIMTQYIDILVDAEFVDDADFKILMLWKTLHIPFFSQIQLFQPEVEINQELRNKIVNMKRDELLFSNKKRQAEMKATTSVIISRFTLKMASSPSVSLVSRSVLNFQKQMRNATVESVSSATQELY